MKKWLFLGFLQAAALFHAFAAPSAASLASASNEEAPAGKEEAPAEVSWKQKLVGCLVLQISTCHRTTGPCLAEAYPDGDAGLKCISDYRACAENARTNCQREYGKPAETGASAPMSRLRPRNKPPGSED